MTPSKGRIYTGKRSVFSIVIIYVILSCLWIFLSDEILSRLISESLWIKVSMLKGWLFILISAAFLYFLIRRLTLRIQKAYEKLRENDQRMRTLFDAIPDIICSKDGDGRWLEANKFELDLFEFKESECKGKTDAELAELFPQHRNTLLGCIKSDEIAWQKRSICRSDETVIKPNGETHIFDIIKIPIFNPDGSRAILFIVGRDITDRKKAEESQKRLEEQLRQSQRLEALGTMAGGIAHGFNNILSAIIGYTEFAKYHLNDCNAVTEALENTFKASERAKNIVRQILTFSRQTKQDKAPLNLESLVKETLQLIRTIISKTVKITCYIEENLPLIHADSTQMQQVLINLSTNAAHAMKNSEGHLDIRIESEDLDKSLASRLELNNGKYIKITVTDVGHGMNKETLEKVFYPFFTTKQTSEGTGLGLAVVHGIVKDHYGAISIESNPGKGTVVTIYLPTLTKVDEVQPSVQKPITKGSGEHILFIDDEPALCNLAELMFKYLGYNITTHSNPKHALELFRSNPENFDFVLIDLNMPGMTGLDFAKEAIQTKPGMPMFLMTGFIGEYNLQNLQSIGIQKVILKPLDFKEIAHLVQQALCK